LIAGSSGAGLKKGLYGIDVQREPRA